MAKSVFTQCDGIVARVSTTCSDDSSLFRIKFDGSQIVLPVTGFALEMGGNYQFLHTVSDFIYFYSFGDRVSELSITGMAFIRRACNTGAGGFVSAPNSVGGVLGVSDTSSGFSNTFIGVGQTENSICDFYDYYRENRAAKKTEAIKLTFGNCAAFWAFLTGMRLEISRPEIPVAQWVMRLHVIPKN
jgi:hypothetical protein